MLPVLRQAAGAASKRRSRHSQLRDQGSTAERDPMRRTSKNQSCSRQVEC